METGLEGKPIYYGAIAAVVLAGGLVAAGYYGKFQQLDRDIQGQTRTLDDLAKKITEGNTAKHQLPQFLEEVQRLELELEKLLRILPSRRKTEDLLRRVRALTEQGDFDLMRFTPRQVQPLDDFYSEWPIEITLRGSYHHLAYFFDRISKLSRIINIENLRISAISTAGGGSSHTIAASFTAKTFLSNEEKPEGGGG